MGDELHDPTLAAGFFPLALTLSSEPQAANIANTCQPRPLGVLQISISPTSIYVVYLQTHRHFLS
jgi:hypothetical protein